MPIYMNITRKKAQVVHGSVLAKGHEGWIELQSAQLGTIRAGGAGNREGSAPSFSDIFVTKIQDDASTGLFRESLSGEGSTITIDFVRTTADAEDVYLSITLQDALITSYQMSGSGGGSQERPMESLSLNYKKITYESHAKGPDVTATVKGHPAAAHP